MLSSLPVLLAVAIPVVLFVDSTTTIGWLCIILMAIPLLFLILFRGGILAAYSEIFQALLLTTASTTDADTIRSTTATIMNKASESATSCYYGGRDTATTKCIDMANDNRKLISTSSEPQKQTPSSEPPLQVDKVAQEDLNKHSSAPSTTTISRTNNNKAPCQATARTALQKKEPTRTSEPQQPTIVLDKYITDDAPYAVLPNNVARDLVHRTKARYASTLAKATFLKEHNNNSLLGDHHTNIPKFILDEDITRGSWIATGGFASVYHATLNNSMKSSDHHQYVIKHLAPKRVLLASSGSSEQVVAVKQRPQSKQVLIDQTQDVKRKEKTQTKRSSKKATPWYASPSYRKLYLSAKDLLLEAHMLATLNHPHILPLAGISEGGIENWATTNRTDAFFLVLPKLERTLEETIQEWKEKEQKNQLSAHHKKRRPLLPHLRKQALDEAFRERFQIIIDLLKALEYLHERRIMHRDVKPGNIGFDQNSCLKLFDFGLAKACSLDETFNDDGSISHHDNNTTKNSTIATLLGNKGTSRYMAPEIINRLPYGCKVDVYSTAITLWQCLTLEKPYNDGKHATAQVVKDSVAIFGDQPEIPKKQWPKGVRQVIELGWARNSSLRPNSMEMKILMEGVMEKPHDKIIFTASTARNPLKDESNKKRRKIL